MSTPLVFGEPNTQGRDDGKARVEAHHPTAIERVRAYAKEYAQAHRGRVWSDPLRAWAEEQGITMHPNAWGSVFKGREWVAVGWIQSTIKSNHARPVRLWVWDSGDDF